METSGIWPRHFHVLSRRGASTTMVADVNENGISTAVEAFNYAKTHTRDYTGNSQNPQLYRGTDGTNDALLYQESN